MSDEAPASGLVRRRLAVSGIVQGVGFRPFVYALATRHGLTGEVRNVAGGVVLEVQGAAAGVDAFERGLRAEAPPLAAIDAIRAETLPPRAESRFAIAASGAPDAVPTPVPPDVAVCDDCLRELHDPADRRYRYPFINCTNCGPRFTLIEGLPYDRAATTMRAFTLCPACRAEYEDPANRRFHAEPNACPACGPRLAFADGDAPATAFGEAALAAAAAALDAGRIVAIKGVGGFHLACDARSEAAVRTLRERKGRGGKPFAVMVEDLAAARRLAAVDETEARLLAGRERPIVLLSALAAPLDEPLAAAVAPGQDTLGLFLPYTPLHHLLLPGRVLVMTSGNRSEEPIAHRDDEARERLAGLADAFLLHDREIHAVCDDSVVRACRGAELPLRRSRGYAPFPLRLPLASPPLLAVGAELKATFCLAREHRAFLSQHIGDLANLETMAAWERTERELESLFAIRPAAIAHDLHPGYLSTQWATAAAAARGVPLVPVQHHHAHAAALLAEHGIADRPILAASFDGTGYGHDGAVWGGELLLADLAGARRLAHLRYTPLPGGDAAIRRPARMALAHLHAAGLDWDGGLPPVGATSAAERRVLARQLETGFGTVPTSSVGRLFDAVGALAGLCQEATFEGEGAMALESAARAAGTVDGAYALELRPGATAMDPLLLDPGPALAELLRDRQRGTTAGRMAARFHAGLAAALRDLALAARERTGIATVGLTGGVFQNVLLLELAADALAAAGFEVLVHRHVPPNDGGLAYGQAAIAARRLTDAATGTSARADG